MVLEPLCRVWSNEHCEVNISQNNRNSEGAKRFVSTIGTSYNFSYEKNSCSRENPFYPITGKNLSRLWIAL